MSGIRTNQYADPNLARAFENLSSLFMPPSGSDLQGYAAANATKQKAEALAQLIANPNDPDADRKATFLGSYNPTQSWRALEMGDATQRYGVDRTYQASTENNAADNARALQTSAMDNQRSAITSLYGSLAPGEIAPAVPDEIMGAIGMPAIDQRTGAPKPLSETEFKAQQQQRLLDSGMLTDEMLLDAINSEKAPVQAVGPDGKTPVYMSPGAAVRQGAQPYDAPADKSLVEGTAVIDGKSVQVYRDPRDSSYRTADGRSVPADVQVFDKAKPTGTNEQLGMKPTEFTERSGMFAVRAGTADETMNNLQKTGYKPTARDFELILGGAGEMMPLSLSNSLVSKEGQQFYNSAMNFMLSVLRPDTGAAFGRDEFQNYARVFIPLPGDDPAVIAEKNRARSTALAALQGVSRGASEQIIQRMIDNGVEVPEEMLQAFERAQSRAPGQSQPQPRQEADAPAEFRDGTVIRNPNSGERMVLRNGEWVPYAE